MRTTNNRLSVNILVGLLVFASFKVGAAPTVLSLPAALDAIRSSSRTVIAEKAVQTAGAEVSIANRSPTPNLGLSASSIQLDQGLGGGSILGAKRIDKGTTIDWVIERGSKLELRTQAAFLNLAVSKFELLDVLTQQQLQVIESYFEALASQEKEFLLQGLLQSADQLLGASRQRFALGDLSQQDLFRIEIESQRAATELAQASLTRRLTLAALALAMGQPRFDDSSTVRSDWPQATSIDEKSAEELAGSFPEVKASDARVQLASAQIRLADSLKKADPSIGVGINNYPGTSSASIGFRWSIPVFSSSYYNGEAERSRAQLEQAEALYRNLLMNAVSRVQQLNSARLANWTRLKQFDDEIIPRGLRVLQQAELAYSKGGLPLTDLLEARRTLKAIQTDALAARTEFAKSEFAWRLRLDSINGSTK